MTGVQTCALPIYGAIAGIALAIAQLGKKGNVSAKAVERQVAVVAIVAVKISPLLAAMERIVGSIKIQHDLGTLARNDFDSDAEPFNSLHQNRLARPNAVNAATGTGHYVLRSLDGDALAKNGAEDFHFRIA